MLQLYGLDEPWNRLVTAYAVFLTKLLDQHCKPQFPSDS